MMVYKQTVAWQCGNYAYLLALQHKWIQITEQDILDLPNFLTHTRAENFLKWKYIKWIAKCITPTIAKNFLRNWEYLVAYVSTGDFRKAWKPPFILWFTDKIFAHFFVIKSFDIGKWLFICQNSWWSTWWMWGDFYLSESDFSKLTWWVQRIIV